ncbi:hypothetical protein [Rhizobium sp. GCM10022189]|uniref:hypothetical protein n=1 Tax=Rhizobium sp. GCM10022189 TaxID=3252654 RepID=UPI00361255A5
MEHGGPKNKSQQDRIRQKVGAKRKEQLQEVRRILQAWKSGRDATASMRAIADVFEKGGVI